MALPLPNVVADVGPGGPLVTSMAGTNALINNLYNTQVSKAQAQYAPYTTYADAASKIAYANMLPYQIQAQVLSNPYIALALQRNPDALSNLLQNFSGSIPNPNNMRNMPPFPQYGNGGNGLLSSLINKITGNNSGQGQSQSQLSPNALVGGIGGVANQYVNPFNQLYGNGGNIGNTSAGNGNSIPISGNVPTNSQQRGTTASLVPAIGGPGQAIIGKTTAQFNQSPYEAGKTFVDANGNIVSTPESSQVNAAQQAILGIKNLRPILQDISSGASKWLAPGEKGKLALGQLMNSLQQRFGSLGGIPDSVMKQFGVSKQDISDYAEWQANQQKAVETIMKARQWPQDMVSLDKVSQIIQPIPGEGEAYGQRVAKELAQIEQTLLPNYQQTLTSGYQLPNAQGTPQGNSQANTPSQYSNNTPAGNWQIWPSNKAPINENDPSIEGREPPKDTVWMVRPDGMQVPVHKQNIELAKEKYKFRGINE